MNRRTLLAVPILAPLMRGLVQDAPSLDGRIGGTLAAFETVHGPPAPRPADTPALSIEFAVPGFSAVLVDDAEGIVSSISLFAPRPEGEEWSDDPHPMNWTIEQARAAARPFLPADAEPRETRDDFPGIIVVEGFSALLAAAVPESAYAYVDDVYTVGQWSTVLFFDSTQLLTPTENPIDWVSVQLQVETPPDQV